MATSGVERIVERQMRNWELARSQRDTESGPRDDHVFEFLAISRQSGSGGLTLAHGVGEQTGWEVYDREILNYMAQDDAVQQKIYEMADEHAEGYFESILKSLGFEGRPPGSDYFRKLVSSINAIAQANHAIFVGRGACFILPAERGLRVRVVAPEKVRFERRARQVGCSLDQASAAVRERDADRDKFLRDHFLVDASSPEHYDIVVNTAAMPTDAAVAMLVESLERKTNIHIR